MTASDIILYSVIDTVVLAALYVVFIVRREARRRKLALASERADDGV